MTKRIKRLLVSFLILFLAVAFYAMWGESGLLVALISGVALEAWFWTRILSKKQS